MSNIVLTVKIYNQESAEGEVITPYGIIRGAWKKEETGEIKLSYKIPEACNAEVIVEKSGA